MRVLRENSERMRHALVTSVVALLAAAPAFALAQPPAPKPAVASHYVPTMADYLGVYDALQNYRFGVEKHDQKAHERAFWEDGVDIASPSPGQEFRMPLNGGFPGPAGAVPPGANAGPPPGAMPPGGHRLGPYLPAGCPLAARPARASEEKSGTCHWTATSISKVRPVPHTTNTSSVFILSQRRKQKAKTR